MLDDSAQAQAHAEACTTTGGQTATAGSPTPPFARAGSESSMFSVSIEMAPGFETRAGPGGAPGEGGGRRRRAGRRRVGSAFRSSSLLKFVI